LTRPWAKALLEKFSLLDKGREVCAKTYSSQNLQRTRFGYARNCHTGSSGLRQVRSTKRMF
jgi:hypothetical protein